MLALWVLVASASVTAAVVVEAPVTSATVYSDRAQVTRTASLTLSGRSLVAFPVLPARASPTSIHLEAFGGEVESITVVPVTEDELPVTEARALLDSIDQLDRQIEVATDEHKTLTGIHDALAALTPVQPDTNERNSPPRLDPTGWLTAMNFLTTFTEGLQSRLTSAERRLSDLREQRLPLAEKARALGAMHPLGGHRVVASVSGKGTARLALLYEVMGARWYPTYDIQLTPSRSQVAIAFAGLVDQETGEDWTEAPLTLSTSVPAQSSKFPKLTAWRIGTSERFVPSPQPEPTWVSPPPPSSPPGPGAHDEIQHLRGLLAAAATGTEAKAAGLPMEADKATEPGRVRRAGSRHIVQRLSPSESDTRVDMSAPSQLESDEVAGIEVARMNDSYSVLASAPAVRKQARRAVAVNIAAPPAYHSPHLAANLPAALAAGYDMVFPSAARETVASGKGARRVALFSQTWPVVVERQIFPALAKEAFLVAMIKNPSKQALPGGRANLFVGDDPAGIADLKFVAPGEMFTLPLGIDQAIKPIRNVTQSTIETGLISKDEVTEYTTVIEFANPYSSPLAVRVKDQIPVTADKDRAEVKLLGSDPAAKLDPEDGALEWRMTVAPGATVKLKFVYSIKRPKGAKMVQR
jgi:hypothetical protein